MRIFSEAKGFATEKTAMAALSRALPEYDDYHWMLVLLPSGRILPAVRAVNTDLSCSMAYLAQKGIGVM